ncbi:MAG: hypothetical protein WGP72_06685, partial [Klebsiella quasipneumoniae]
TEASHSSDGSTLKLALMGSAPGHRLILLVSQKSSITKNLIFSVITSLTIITGEINAYRMAINSIYYATALIQYRKMTNKNSMLNIKSLCILCFAVQAVSAARQ